MNRHLLEHDVQLYIREQLHADVHQIALGKSPFQEVSGKELANQIAARKKSARKLPVWFNTPGIYFPALLSIEQCSSEITAAYKALLARGDNLIDLTGGFGVDSFYFSKLLPSVIHCEINEDLSEIAAHNAEILGQPNISFINGDGLDFLRNTDRHFGTIYIDPARRSESGKVFMLTDCTPDIVKNLGLLLNKGNRILIKTAPLLDISMGLKELSNVAEIHIVSVKNECKELIWVLEPKFSGIPRIIASALNSSLKQFIFLPGEESPVEIRGAVNTGDYLYEPDVALLKTGAFNLIAERYHLQKFHSQTQLYTSSSIETAFPGRIFKINEVLSSGLIKKEKELRGSVIVRNYPDKAAALVSKYRIKPDDQEFIVFTQSKTAGKIVLKCTILQHY